MAHPEITKYLNYKKMFNLSLSPSLRIFEELLMRIKNYSIEFSNTIDGINIYNQRLNIWFDPLVKHGDMKKNLLDVLSFFKQLEDENNIKLDYSLVSYVLKNFDISEIYRLTLGIDFRFPIKNSRLKLWFTMKEFSEKIENIIKIHGKFSEIMPFINVDKERNNLFGIVLSFAGSITLPKN